MGSEQSRAVSKERSKDFLTDDVKDTLMEWIECGLEFVEVPENLRCSSCGGVPLFHYVYPCGHPYCRDCYLNFFCNVKGKCKVCNTDIGTKTLQKREIEFAIYELKVCCPNTVFGCKQEVTLSRLLSHLNECKCLKGKHRLKIPKPTLELTNKTSVQEAAVLEELRAYVDEMMMKKEKQIQELVKGNRITDDKIIRLTEANWKLSADNRKLRTDLVALKKLVTEDSVIRKHLESLEQKMQQFSHSIEMGSKPNVDEKVIARMKNMDEYLDTTVETFNAVRDQMEMNFNFLTKRVDSIDPKVRKSVANQRRLDFKSLNINSLTQEDVKEKIEEIREWRNGTLLWQIEEWDQKIREKATCYSASFCSSQNGHTMRAEFEFCGNGGLSDRIQFLFGENCEMLPLGFHFRVTYSILDQSGERRNTIQMDEPRFGMSAQGWMKYGGNIGISDFSELQKYGDQNMYVKNHTVYVKVIVEPISYLFGNYFSRDGTLLWTIDNYARTKQESQKIINPVVYSDYFYSSQTGYRMQAQLAWDGDRIYFDLCFLVGESDKQLPSFYSHKCSVYVVNQKISNRRRDLVVGNETLDATAVGQEQVKRQMADDCCHSMDILQSKVEKKPFLINDRIILKVAVKGL